MRTNSIIMFSSIIILLILNFLLSSHLKSLKRNVHDSKIYSNFKNISDSIEIENLRAALYESYWLNKSDVIELIEQVLFNDRDQEGIILSIGRNQCIQCIKSIIMDFEILQQDTHYKNFYIIGDFDKKEDFDSLLTKIDTELECTNIQYKFNFPFKCQYPSVFIIDKDLYPKYFFVPAIFPTHREEYFYKLVYGYIQNKRFRAAS